MENKEKIKECINGCLRNERKSQEQLFKLVYKCLNLKPVKCLSPSSYQNFLLITFNEIFLKLGMPTPGRGTGFLWHEKN